MIAPPLSPLWYDNNLANPANLIDKTIAKEYNDMEESELMSTIEAAEYLAMPLATLKWHVVKKHIAPQKIGRTLIFTRAQLDEFKLRPQPQTGRPKKVTDK